MSNHPSSSVSSQSGSSELSSLEGPPNHGFDQSDELLHHLAISVGLEIGTALGGSRLTTATLNALVSHFVSALMGEAPYPSPEWFRAMVEAVMSRATTEMALDVPEEVRDEVDARVVEGVEALIQYILVELEEKRESTREGRQQKNLLRKQLWGDSLSVVAIGLEESFWDRYAGAKVALYRSNRSETHDGQSSNAEVRVPSPNAEVRGAMRSPSPRVVSDGDDESQGVVPVETGPSNAREPEGAPVVSATLKLGSESDPTIRTPWLTASRAATVAGGHVSGQPDSAKGELPRVGRVSPQAESAPEQPKDEPAPGSGQVSRRGPSGGVGDALSEASLEKIRKAVKAAKAPPGAPIRLGGTEILSSFRVFYKNQALINGWSEVHEFYWLSLNIETKLWLQISGVKLNLLPNPLSRACYGQAAAFIWSSLERRFGADKEIEKLQAESLTLSQRPSEKLLAYLGRVNDYRARSHYANLTRKDSQWIAAARSGIRDPLMRRLSYLPVDPNIRESSADEIAPIGEWEAWLISMEQLTMNEGDAIQQGVSQDEAVTVFETQAGPPGAQGAAKGAGRRRERRSPFAGKCYGCQEFGHRIADCPQRKNSAGGNKEGKAGGSAEAAAAESGGPVDDAEKSPPGEDKTKPRESEDCTVQTASYAVDCYTVPIASYAVDCHHAKQSAGNDSVRSYAITEADRPPVLLLDFGGHRQEGLVDTGSATSLVDLDTAKHLCQLGHAVWTPTRLRVTVKYADAREEVARGEVILRATVNGSVCYLPCLVVERLGRSIILGRRSLKLLGTELKFRQDSEAVRCSLREAFKAAGEMVSPPDAEANCGSVDIAETVECYTTNGELFVDDQREPSHPEKGQQIGRDVVDRKLRPILSEAVEAGVGEKTPDEFISQALQNISELGELPVAEGYALRLKKLESDDAEPAEEGQEYRFLASWQVRQAGSTGSAVWNSASLIHRLQQQEREEFQKNCDYYVTKGFWKEKTPKEGLAVAQNADSSLMGVIFPVRQDPNKSTAVRPVCDLRQANLVSPPVSNTQLTTSDATMRLRSRLQPSHVVAQYDLQKAFYSVEVDITNPHGQSVPLELSVGGAVYETRRLVFGLSCGPLILNTTQRIDLMVAEAAYRAFYGDDKANPPPNVVVVMDDFLLSGSEVSVKRFESLLLCCWQKTGFRCPDDKRARWNESCAVRWLGGYWKWSAQKGELSLSRPEVSFVKDFPQAKSSVSLSKRQVFKYGGQFIGISCGVGETLARSHADCARVLASRTEAWDQKGGDWVKEAWLHLSLASRYWDRAREEEDQALPLYSGVKSLCAEIDASGVGFGYVWKDGSDGQVLACAARIQSRSMSVGSWHVNRRELYAIAWCLQRLEDCLSFFPLVTSVQLLSDSSVAVKQSDVWTVPRCKSVERKAILRLRGVICDTVHALAVRSPAVNVVTGHISGAQNHIADALSRTAITRKFVCVSQWLRVDDSEEVSVECQYVAVHSWLYEGDAGSLALPSYRAWLTARDAFDAWLGRVRSAADDAPFRDWMILQQAGDDFCKAQCDRADADGFVEAEGMEYGYLVDDLGLVYRLRPPSGKDVEDGPRRQLVLPNSIIGEFALAVHQQCGHGGVAATTATIYQAAWAKHLHKAVKKALRGCLNCQLTRDGGRVQIRMGACKMPRRCFEVMGADLFGPLKRPTALPDERRVKIRGVEPPKEPSHFILTLVDRLSSYTFYRLIPDGKSETIVSELELIFLSIGRFPRELWVDNAQSFVGSVALSAFCLSVGTSLRCIPSYTPSVGGWWERHHRELGSTLRSALNNTPTASWRLLTALGQLRTNQSYAHKLIFGYDPSVPILGALESISEKQLPERFPKKQEAMEEAQIRSRRRDDALVIFEEIWLGRRAEAAERFKGKVTAVDASNPLEAGDSVILFDGRPSSKLGPKASGPYIVIRSVGKQCYEISSDGNRDKSAIIHGSRLRKYEADISQ